jgi:hypothetical protein
MNKKQSFNRMFIYAWEDLDSPNEVKFGEHFVYNCMYDQGIDDTTKYIRSSLGRQKYKFDQNRVKIHMIQDVTDYAISVNRMKIHSKLDDYIRDQCLIRRQGRGEFHKMSGDSVVRAVYEFLEKANAPLMEASLSTAQFEAAVEVVDAINNNGAKTILAELCARFGKTIWSSAVATETEAELVVVASYIKTVFTSFATDIIRFNQFRNYVHVDTSEDGYEQKIEQAFANGKKVFAYLSLCGGSKRQHRIDYLFGLNKNRFVIIDEADFGAHKQNQAEPLRAARQSNDIVVIMTGTNADRAVTGWKIDRIVSTNYFELLTHKKDALK